MLWYRKKLSAAALAAELSVWGRLPEAPLARPLFAISAGGQATIYYAPPSNGEPPPLETQNRWWQDRVRALGFAASAAAAPLHALEGWGAPAGVLHEWPAPWPGQPAPAVDLYAAVPPQPLPERVWWRGHSPAARAALLQIAAGELAVDGAYLWLRPDLPEALLRDWLGDASPAIWVVDDPAGNFSSAGFTGRVLVLQSQPPIDDWPVLAAPEPVRARTQSAQAEPPSLKADNGSPALGWLAASGPWPLDLYDAVSGRFGGESMRDALALGRASVEGGQIRAVRTAESPPPPPPELLEQLCAAAPEAALVLTLAANAAWPADLAARAAASIAPKILLEKLRPAAGADAMRLRLRALLDLGRTHEAAPLLQLAEFTGEFALKGECEALAENGAVTGRALASGDSAAMLFFHAHNAFRRNGDDVTARAILAADWPADDLWAPAALSLREFLASRVPEPATAPWESQSRPGLWAAYYRAYALRAHRRDGAAVRDARALLGAGYHSAQCRGWSVLQAVFAIQLADLERQEFAFGAGLARCTEVAALIDGAGGCYLHRTRLNTEGCLLIETGRPKRGLAQRRQDGNPGNLFWLAQAKLLQGDFTAARAALAPLRVGPDEDFALLAEHLHLQLEALGASLGTALASAPATRPSSTAPPREFTAAGQSRLAPARAALRALGGEPAVVPAPPDPAQAPEDYALSAPLLVAARLLGGLILADSPETITALEISAPVAVPLLLLLARRKPVLLKEKRIAAALRQWSEILADEAPRTAAELRRALMEADPPPLAELVLALLALAEKGGAVRSEALQKLLSAAGIHRPARPGDWSVSLLDGEVGISESPWAAHPAGRALSEATLARLTLEGNGDAPPVRARWVEGLYFGSAAGLYLLEQIETAAPFPIPVYIRGAAGSGKEGVARLLHHFSRPRGPLVPVNCASLERELADAQLFGAKRGAYTGALEDRPGLVGEAEGGTLFLDEFLELPLATQSKLLRFLENGEYYRLGENKPRFAKTRVVCASNGDPIAALAAGKLREDLWQRVSGIVLKVTPLHGRRSEILPLFEGFIASLARAEGLRPPAVSATLAARLLAHDWPGQVRELRRSAEHALLRARGRAELLPGDLPPQFLEISRPGEGENEPAALPAHLDRYEKLLIETALREHRSAAAAARALGISRQSLFQKMKRLEMQRMGEMDTGD